MSITLYEHQAEGETKLIKELQHKDKVLFRAPTRFGKTVLASSLINRLMNQNKKVWFINHRKELIFQSSKTFNRYNLGHSYIAADYDYSRHDLFHVCSIDSLNRRIKKIKPSDYPYCVIWDEAHHIGAKSWHNVMDLLVSSKHIGLTATPCRLDGKPIGNYFESMVESANEKWLIQHGYLADYDYYGGMAPGQVKLSMGDYNQKLLAEVSNKKEIIGDMVRNWKEHAYDKTTVGFFVNIEHSKRVAELFNQAGIPAVHMDSDTKPEVRQETAKRLANRDIMLLCNVGLLGEGYDLSAQADTDVTIEATILGRKTKSISLYRQMASRCLTPKPDRSKAVILDHADCWAELKCLPDTEIEWSFTGKVAIKNQEYLTHTQCKKCYHVYIGKGKCPSCGHYEPPKKQELIEVPGNLSKINKEMINKLKKQEQAEARTLEELRAIEKARGYKRGWAERIYKARGGKRGNQHSDVTSLEAYKNVKIWVKSQAGRVNRNDIMKHSKIRNPQTITKIISKLIEEKFLTRMANGQITAKTDERANPSNQDNGFPF